VVSLAAKRLVVVYLEQTYGVSERRACRVLSCHHSTQHRQPGSQERTELIGHLQTLSERYPRFGSHKIFALLKADQWRVSRETVRRLRVARWTPSRQESAQAASCGDEGDRTDPGRVP